MSVFDFLENLEEVVHEETLEAPKKATRKPKPPPLETEELEELTEECPPAVLKKGKGRPKKVKEPVDQDDSPPKPKRQQTEAQKANFKKALEKRKENIQLRKASKELERQIKEDEIQEKKKEVERKVIKKAVCLKKKEIISQAALDEISDEEIPDAIVEKIIKKQRAKSAPKQNPKPVASEPVPQNKYNFV